MTKINLDPNPPERKSDAMEQLKHIFSNAAGKISKGIQQFIPSSSPQDEAAQAVKEFNADAAEFSRDIKTDIDRRSRVEGEILSLYGGSGGMAVMWQNIASAARAGDVPGFLNIAGYYLEKGDAISPLLDELNELIGKGQTDLVDAGNHLADVLEKIGIIAGPIPNLSPQAEALIRRVDNGETLSPDDFAFAARYSRAACGEALDTGFVPLARQLARGCDFMDECLSLVERAKSIAEHGLADNRSLTPEELVKWLTDLESDEAQKPQQRRNST